MDALLSPAGTDLTSEMVGIPIALLLLLLATLLLPAAQRRRARQGAVLLALSLVCGAARFVFPPGASVRRPLLFAATFFLLASIGRSAVLLLVDVLLERRTARPAPKIFRDMATGLAYLAVALVALHAGGVEPGSILTTSALLTAVIGLALQDTLGNLVSGLALQMQRPFDVGDWIEVEQAHAGQVTQMTWRATSIMTLDHVEVILPNASLARSAVRNYSRPSRVSRRRLVIGITYDASPSVVHAVLAAAAADAPGVLSEPPARARTKSFGDSAIVYEVLYFVDDFAHALDVDGVVADRVYHALARRGIGIPFPTHAVIMAPAGVPEKQRDDERKRIARALASVALMQPLPDDSHAVLAERAHVRRYGPGEAVVRKGDASLEMFVVEQGTLAVEVPRELKGVAEVAQLGPGECFGEMGLLTGEARSATVRAKTLCDLVVIDHDAFHEVLAAHPEVVERMGGLLAARQAGLEAAAVSAERAAPPEERKQRLISQIKSFFKLV
ncbi:MAG TPA: mechanosensitive ion channel family protein [Polyangiaceae bacterium]|jgi:small-conductance mechanosensitive channel/CRP-like cAMP-binding protein